MSELTHHAGREVSPDGFTNRPLYQDIMATPVTSLDQYRQAHSANGDALPAQNPSPKKPGFRLTASALTWLVNDGMSQLLVDKLAEKLQDQPFDKEEEFWAAVKTAIGEDAMETNKPLIWEYAVNPILAEMKTMLTAKPCFRLARASLRWLQEDGVPEEVLKSLSALQDQAFENEADFLNAVQTQIGEASTTQYKTLIWKYAADNSALKEFFRNQQRFIHLYLLSQGCKVTSQIIKKLMENLDRTFAPQTYYGLRRELKEDQWIQEDASVPNTSRGPTEFPHFIPNEEKREKFLETVIAASTIERPVVISKFHVFDLAVKLFKKQWDALLPIVKQAQGTFFTDFVVRELIETVFYLKAQNPIPDISEEFLQDKRIAADIPDPIWDYYWQHPYFGQELTGADIGEPPHHLFTLDNGTVTITCYWRGKREDQPASFWVSWNAKFLNDSPESELHLLFVNPDAKTIRNDLNLGRSRNGQETFTIKELDFDPVLTKQWAIAVYMK